jgi:hypothetical protein
LRQCVYGNQLPRFGKQDLTTHVIVEHAIPMPLIKSDLNRAATIANTSGMATAAWRFARDNLLPKSVYGLS